MKRGFTIIELLVVIVIIGIIASVGLVWLRSPKAQARDAKRSGDIAALQLALEIFYVKNNTYPLSTPEYQIAGVPWGGSWDGYLKRVPKDPLSPAQEYIYVSSDGKTYQLYANFETTPPNQWACPNSCGPDGKYNAGIAAGTGSSLVTFAAATTTITITPTPTPPPLSGQLAALVQGPQTWSISQRLAIPQMYSLWTSTIDPASEGGKQEVQLSVKDDQADVTSVAATIQTDNGWFTKTLNLTSGSPNDGTWLGSWTVSDAYNNNFIITFAAEDAAGNRSSVDFAIR